MKNRSILLLRVHQNNPKREETASEFFSQLAEILRGKNTTISAEIVIHNKFLWFFLTCPEQIKEIIKGQWYAQYPHTEIEEIKDHTQKLLLKDHQELFAGCELYYDKSKYLPLKTYKDLEKTP